MAGRAQDVEAGLGFGIGDLKERTLETSATLTEKLSDGTRVLREYIVKEPARALGIALGMGVLLGWLIKRR